MVRWLLFTILLWGSCIYAAWRGGREERLVAASFITADLLTIVVTLPYGERFKHLELSYLVDAALFIFLTMVSLWSERFWPMWMAAMQGITLISHLSVSFAPEVGPWTYRTAVAFWSYPMLVLLATVTYRRWGRQSQRMRTAPS